MRIRLNPVRLTIAIPTFNRAESLRERVSELLPQLTSEVELFISDNASTDDTPAVTADAVSPRVRYVRNQTNIGAELNFVKCIDSARGDWLWLLGDDDPVESDAVATILAHIQQTSAQWLMFQTAWSNFKASVPNVKNVQQMLEHVPLTALTFISGVVVDSALLKRNVGLYAQALFTFSPQVAVCVVLLERGALVVEIVAVRILRIQPARPVEWSTLSYITGAIMLPSFLRQRNHRQLMARSLQEVHRPALEAHLPKIGNQEELEKWQSVYQLSYSVLKVYEPQVWWRELAVLPLRAGSLRTFSDVLFTAALVRCPRYVWFCKLLVLKTKCYKAGSLIKGAFRKRF
jgi:hypothetical protein